MTGSLDDVLSGKAEAKPAAPETPEPAKAEAKPDEQKAEQQQEAKPEKARDESGKFVKKEGDDSPAATPAAKSFKENGHDPESGLKAGITAERKKRQEAERRLQELERQLQRPQVVPDVIADPQGYAKHVQGVTQAALVDQKVDLTVDLARERHDDFDAVMGVDMQAWNEAVAADPSLYAKAVAQRNPGEWAYQHLKREKVFSEIGDPEAWKKAQMEALRKELEPTLRKELEAKVVTNIPPPSLASASSGGRINADPTGVDRKPFEKIFAR